MKSLILALLFAFNASATVTINGTMNGLPAAATAGVTSPVGISDGGTGQTTKAPAFNALSPMTTGGDLIYGGASGVGTRLANGTATHVLTSNGTTLAPSWQAAPTPSLSTIRVTDAYNAAAPCYSFASNTGTGMCNVGDTIYMISNGAAVAAFLTGIFLPTSGNAFDMGHATSFWYRGYMTNLFSNTVTAASDAGFKITTPGTRPTCDSGARHMTWYTEGASLEADSFAICTKDITDTYGWRALF